MEMNTAVPNIPDRNSITISMRFKCSLCEFQCLRLPEAEQHSMKEHCTIQPFLCDTCTVSCKTYHDALNHLATPSASHTRPPKMEERDVERWAQFQFVLTSYTVFLTVTCREDIIFLCSLCSHSTCDTETAVKHLVGHKHWKREDLKGHCDVCTFYYLSRIDSIKRLRDFSGALNGCTHNIAACLLSNLKITLKPIAGRSDLRSQTINWSAIFSTKKPNISGSAVPFSPDFSAPNIFGQKYPRLPDPKLFTPPSVLATSDRPPDQAAMPWPVGTSFKGNPTMHGPTMFTSYGGPPPLRLPRPNLLPQSPPNPNRPPRLGLTFEQHMARERMLWIMDERCKRQMTNDSQDKILRNKMRRQSSCTGQAIASKGANGKSSMVSDKKTSSIITPKRSRPNQPVAVIDLTDAEGDNESSSVTVEKNVSVDNVSSTTLNGELEISQSKALTESPPLGPTDVATHDKNGPAAAAELPVKAVTTGGHGGHLSQALSSTDSNRESTQNHYDDIFLEDDHGFYSDVQSDEEDTTKHEILDLRVKRQNLATDS